MAHLFFELTPRFLLLAFQSGGGLFEVLKVTHFLGMSHAQAADQLGMPVGTVKSRLYRAHRRMAELLSHVREATA